MGQFELVMVVRLAYLIASGCAAGLGLAVIAVASYMDEARSGAMSLSGLIWMQAGAGFASTFFAFPDMPGWIWQRGKRIAAAGLVIVTCGGFICPTTAGTIYMVAAGIVAAVFIQRAALGGRGHSAFAVSCLAPVINLGALGAAWASGYSVEQAFLAAATAYLAITCWTCRRVDFSFAEEGGNNRPPVAKIAAASALFGITNLVFFSFVQRNPDAYSWLVLERIMLTASIALNAHHMFHGFLNKSHLSLPAFGAFLSGLSALGIISVFALEHLKPLGGPLILSVYSDRPQEWMPVVALLALAYSINAAASRALRVLQFEPGVLKVKVSMSRIALSISLLAAVASASFLLDDIGVFVAAFILVAYWMMVLRVML